MVDWITIASVVSSVIVSSASLGYWLGRKFAVIDSRFASIESRISNLEKAFMFFSESLLTLLQSRGVLTPSEASITRNYLRALLPVATSKYYTKEVYEKLKKLLDKNPDDLTLDETYELEDIAELMIKEGSETGNRRLIDYAYRLKFYAILVRAVCIFPKIAKAEQLSQMRRS